MSADRRIAVLGAWRELDDPAAGHRQVVDDAIERGIDVIAVGTDLYGIRPVDDPVAAARRDRSGRRRPGQGEPGGRHGALSVAPFLDA